MEWDLFISHASEDKDDVARPLAQKFVEQGLSVWFDEDTLIVGDSLRRSIDHGLGNCRFGLVILSNSFFAKEWPQKELDGLVAREDGSGKRILPVWHNVTRSDVVKFSPPLADKLGVSTSRGLDHVVREILKAFQKSAKPLKATSSPKTSSSTAATKTKKPGTTKPVGTWVMLSDRFFLASSIRHQSDGKLEIVISPTNGDEEAELASLRPTQFNNRRRFPFAVSNDAHLVQIDQVTTETISGHQQWMLSLSIIASGPSNSIFEMNVNGVEADEIARRRAGRILINDPPPTNSRVYTSDSLIEATIVGNGEFTVKECVVRSVFQRHGKSPEWKEFARLKSVFMLKMTGTVQHVLQLSLGVVRANRISVEFRGRREKKYSNVDPATVEIKGSCPLVS